MEIPTEIIEKESKNFKPLSNIKKENYKENEKIKEKIKSNENLNYVISNSNIAGNLKTKSNENNLNALIENKNLSDPEFKDEKKYGDEKTANNNLCDEYNLKKRRLITN